jgi:hypothetical protein
LFGKSNRYFKKAGNRMGMHYNGKIFRVDLTDSTVLKKLVNLSRNDISAVAVLPVIISKKNCLG